MTSLPDPQLPDPQLPDSQQTDLKAVSTSPLPASELPDSAPQPVPPEATTGTRNKRRPSYPVGLRPNNRPNPFIGPRAFQPGESLYGRERETAQLLNQFIADRIVLLYSPSGAGKTSLINAALLPRLKLRRFTILPTIRINLEPPAALASQPGFNRYTFSALTSLEEGRPAAERMPETELCQLNIGQYLEAHPTETTALVFDQFEEILTLDPTDVTAKQDFFDQVGEALSVRNRWALFSMREDYLAGLDPYTLPIPTRLSSTFRLDLLDKDAAGEVLRRTTASQGVEFMPDAAQRLLDDLSRVQVQRLDGSVDVQYGRYIEPVQLQVVCRNIWERIAPDDPRISLADIEAIGDVDRSLAEYYATEVQIAAGFAVQAAAMLGHSRTPAAAERAIREWFDRVLITEGGLRGQVLMSPNRSEGLENAVIYQLVDAHLVRAEKRRGATWFELAHDRLIRPVREDNATWFLDNLSLLQRQAALWELQGRPDHLLLRGDTLQKAEDWANTHTLTQVETTFLEACRDAEHQELQARQAQEQAIQLAEQRRLSNRLRILLAVALLAALIASFLGSEAYFARQSADRSAAANATTAAENRVIAATAQYFSTQAVAGQATAEAERQSADQARLAAETERQSAELARQAAENAQLAAEKASQAEAQQRRIAETRAQQAQAQANLADSRQLAAQAFNYLVSQPDLAALLAVEAYTTSQTTQARSMMLSVIQTGLQQTFRPQGVQPGEQPADIYRVALSPDGDLLAWADAHGTVTLWDLRQNRIISSHTRHVNRSFNEVHGLAFSPDSRSLVSGDYGGLLVTWNFIDNTFKEVKGVVNSVSDLAFSPDGTRLAAAVGSQVSIWNWPGLDNRMDLRGGHWDFINAIAWSPDGKRLASGADDRKVIIWSTDTGQRIQILTGHAIRAGEPGVSDLDWSSLDVLASAGGDGDIIIWDLLGGKVGKRLPAAHGGKPVNTLAFSSDGSLLASGGGDTAIRLFAWPSLQQISQLGDFHTRTVSTLAFSPAGIDLLASGGYDNQVGLHRVTPQQPLAQTILNAKGPIIAIQALADGQIRYLRGGERNASLWLWDGTSASQAGGALPASVFASFGGDNLATGQSEGPLNLFNAGSGKMVARLQTPPGFQTALALSPDGLRLASALCSGPVIPASACSQRQVWTWNDLSDLASAQAQALITYNTPPTANTSPTATQTQTGSPFHRDILQSLAYDPLKPVLATGGRDGLILQWLTDSGQNTGLPLQQDAGAILSLAYSPVGNLLASGEGNAHLVLWDLETLQPIGAPLAAAGEPLLSVAFSPDGKQLYTGDEAGNLLAWDINPASWLQRACQMAHRNLTEAEWRQFRPSQDYRPTCPQWPLAP